VENLKELLGLEPYRLELQDPYWIRLRDQLIEKGLPRSIVEPALIRADRESSIKRAYV